jgi:hypothetical protein
MLFRRRPKPRTAMVAGERLVRSPQVISAMQGGETILMDVGRETYHTLNEVGTRVWEILATGASAEAISATICAEYALPPGLARSDVERDILGLLSQLRDLRLLSTDSRNDAHGD